MEVNVKNIFIGGVAKSGKSRLATYFCKKYELSHIALDSAHILPGDIVNYLNSQKWDIYYLGYQDITPQEKIEEIRNYSRGGWTSKNDVLDLIKE